MPARRFVARVDEDLAAARMSPRTDSGRPDMGTCEVLTVTVVASARAAITRSASGGMIRRARRPRNRPSSSCTGRLPDSSGWNPVLGKLLAAGDPALAFANPLRGPVGDGEYFRQFQSTVSRPVVLVEHADGCAVIANGATGTVRALVDVGRLPSDGGESVAASRRARRWDAPSSPTT